MKHRIDTVPLSDTYCTMLLNIDHFARLEFRVVLRRCPGWGGVFSGLQCSESGSSQKNLCILVVDIQIDLFFADTDPLPFLSN